MNSIGVSPKVNTVLNPLSFSICCGKQLGKQAARFLKTGFGEGNRFCFADRIGNEAFFVQSIHGIPIERLPGPKIVMQAKVQQGQDNPIDSLCIEFHEKPPCVGSIVAYAEIIKNETR
ncbi:MAG: hypothetical protein KKB32_03370 [Acidobacteria bacterium]|nr:hypothetical protein [Acidobacteriota bacterium]